MHFTTATIHALLATSALAAGVHRRNLQTAQDCLAKIQSAGEAMNTALMVGPLPLSLYMSPLPDQPADIRRASTPTPTRAATPSRRASRAPRAP